MRTLKHVYEIRPSNYRRTFELISNVLPVGRAGGFIEIAAAVRSAKTYSGSHPVVIRVYDDVGKVIETHKYNDE